ncbi:protein kinase domain-containing protein [Gordonia terrae]|uniref:non-specific serine/threonine protein kinase n=2 Tax=Gordonia terrae TaxID=2055 RepID=A0AAD0NYD0_9ACTN|nr:protein kinase [Gordonia terrae]VTR07511.1 protein kinase [Clostridioides difficile]ANY24018.1 serine/threonine protein kinase [Gordonia terrae]AWO84758.1 serine/threonine protein kinase [Gordonia terrae]VTS56521.1 Serine/threonine-protein kinase pknB [Gordonia terrae]GAB46010.1 serine/threonine protein kinase PknL [Gordonia terrae NBRC 100016]
MNSPVDTMLGTVLEDRYRIDAPIARGGMSAVYLAVDLRLGRDVAVKVMDSRYSGDPQFLRRFEFEARAVAGLKHPGLVAVYDQGIDNGIAFLVMELVDGGSLRELLRERGPMPPHAVVAVAAPVLGGLGTAHAAGLVHRDVKPENVLISDEGEVKVADFGLVRAVAEAGVTSASVILGTAAYLSPEQVESTHADARSDVYSMGVMMFELLTGRTPFSGDSPLALAYQRLSFDVPAPGDVIAGVPEEFDEIVLRATERNPADRYVDGFDMQRALLGVADELDLPPFTVPAPRRSAERQTVSRYRSPDPGGHGTRVQSVPGPHTPASEPVRQANDTPVEQPAAEREDLAPSPRPVTRRTARPEAVEPELIGGSRLGALMWIVVVLLLTAGLGALGFWVGSTFLAIG